jgi:hypothetical protein
MAVGSVKSVELADMGEHLLRKAEEHRAIAEDQKWLAENWQPSDPPTRVDELIAEGKVRPPRSQRIGPLPKPIGPLDETEALSRALQYVRGDR